MSSFRIDRQYVSFETAETQPVHAKNYPSAAPAADGPDAYGGDISRLYNDIYERLRAEHAEQAEMMLSRAADEALEIVEKAKRQAEEIATLARAESDNLREELRSTLLSEARARKQKEEKELSELVSTLRNDYFKLVEEMRGGITALVMEIAKKVISVKLSQSDEVFMGLVRDALERLKLAASVVIRVSAEDYQRYFGGERGFTGLDAGDVKIAVSEEPGFLPGDLVVESEGEMVDLGINRQIGLIEEAFQS